MTGVSAGLDPAEVERVVETALAEDLRLGADVTTLATVSAHMRGEAALVARASGVVAGLHVAEAVFQHIEAISVAHGATDGDRVSPGDVLMTLQGPLRAILTGERTALNLLDPYVRDSYSDAAVGWRGG